MASTSTSTDNVTKECFFLAIRAYPPVINGKVNIIEFIDASTDLVAVVGMYEHLMLCFTLLKLF